MTSSSGDHIFVKHDTTVTDIPWLVMIKTFLFGGNVDSHCGSTWLNCKPGSFRYPTLQNDALVSMHCEVHAKQDGCTDKAKLLVASYER